MTFDIHKMEKNRGFSYDQNMAVSMLSDRKSNLQFDDLIGMNFFSICPENVFLIPGEAITTGSLIFS